MKRILTVPAQVDRLSEVFAFVDEASADAGMEMKSQNNVRLAVEEIFVNIASYAYPSGEGDVTVSVSVEAERFTVAFADGGTPYDPLAKPDPDTTLPAAEREIGGLGIFMVKKIMDNVEYRYENLKNILTIEIIFDPKGEERNV